MQQISGRVRLELRSLESQSSVLSVPILFLLHSAFFRSYMHAVYHGHCLCLIPGPEDNKRINEVYVVFRTQEKWNQIQENSCKQVRAQDKEMLVFGLRMQMLDTDCCKRI